MTRRSMCLAAVVAWCATSVLSADQGGNIARGEQVYVAQKCNICHSVAGKGNKNGALDGVASKLSAADMRAWITSPAEMAKKHNATRKPPMKSFASLPKEDVEALVAYLQTLKK